MGDLCRWCQKEFENETGVDLLATARAHIATLRLTADALTKEVVDEREKTSALRALLEEAEECLADAGFYKLAERIWEELGK